MSTRRKKENASLLIIFNLIWYILTPYNTVAALKAPPKASGPRTAKSDGVNFPSLGDKTRDTCRVLIYDALAIDSGARVCSLPFFYPKMLMAFLR